MNKNQHTGNPLTQQIEKDYISNMLGIAEQEASPQTSTADVSHEPVDFNAPYKQADFECQIFDIVGLNIAVASDSISEIINQQQILQNQSEQLNTNLFVGTINTGNKTINVIDLEYLVMNGIGERDKIGEYPHGLADIVLLKGSNAAFIGNQLAGSKTISKQHVHWRDEKSERIWLAGTVAKMGLALLDIEGLINLLNSNIK